MINVIVVDDEWYNLEEISDLIEKTSCLEIKKKYQNPLDALNDFEKIMPDVAFIDIEMPEMSGTALAEKLREIKPSILIVFITAFKQYAADAFEINAVDYIVKPIRIERFNNMIERLKEKISVIKIAPPCTNILSSREVEVISLTSKGFTQYQIADKLCVSLSSVKRHVESIYQKLNVNNKVMAIKKAESMNII